MIQPKLLTWMKPKTPCAKLRTPLGKQSIHHQFGKKSWPGFTRIIMKDLDPDNCKKSQTHICLTEL